MKDHHGNRRPNFLRSSVKSVFPLYAYEVEHISGRIERKYKVSSNGKGKHTNGSEGDPPEVEELPFG